MLRTSLVCLALSSLAACALEDDAVDESTTSAYIHGADSLASQSHANRAVAMVRFADGAWRRFCTGTFIDDDHVLTASHCKTTVSDRVFFYTVPNQMDSGRVRQIVNIFRRPGTNPFVDDFDDDNGDFADIAVIQLAATAGPPAVPAALRWTYPGAGEVGVKVGGGSHSSNTVAQLRQVTDETDSPDDNDGSFMTEDEETDPGDSGGPFYIKGLWVTGVLYGDWYDADSVAIRNLYTSVPHHLSWILDKIDYTWSGGATSSNVRRNGTFMSIMPFKPLNVCEYACDRSPTCVAFNHNSVLNQCELLSAVTSTSSVAGYRSDLKP